MRANSRFFGLIGSSVIALIQHFQLASFYRHAMKVSDGNWDKSPREVFGDLQDLALMFYGDTFIVFYYLSLVLAVGSAVIYILLHEWVHRFNMKVGMLTTPLFSIWEYVIFGFGFVPMIGNLGEVTYCDASQKLQRQTSTDCFDHTQTFLVGYSFFGISCAVFMAGGVFPGLKSERKSVERNAKNDTLFAVLYQLLIVTVILLVAPMQLPWVGILLHVLAILYLMVYEGFAELHVASLRMAILFAQMWLFCSAYQTQNSNSEGSTMLYLWPLFLLLGYAILPLKHVILSNKR